MKKNLHNNDALPESIAALLEGVRPTKEVVSELEKAVRALADDPEFIADCLKSQVVNDVYRVMEAKGINQNQLAAKLGKSRQYVSHFLAEDRRVNFTLETLAQLSFALQSRVVVRMLPPDEVLSSIHLVHKMSAAVPMIDAPLHQREAYDSLPFVKVSNFLQKEAADEYKCSCAA